MERRKFQWWKAGITSTYDFDCICTNLFGRFPLEGKDRLPFNQTQLWEEGGGGEDIYYPVVAQRLFQDVFSTAASLKPW